MGFKAGNARLQGFDRHNSVSNQKVSRNRKEAHDARMGLFLYFSKAFGDQEQTGAKHNRLVWLLRLRALIQLSKLGRSSRNTVLRYVRR